MPSKARRKLRDLAIQRIVYLYRLAVGRARSRDYGLARRYVELAIRIAHKARVKPPKYIRRGYCRRCRVPLVPGLTARYRVRSVGRRGSRVVVTCLLCGWMRRYMIKTRSGEE